MINSTQNDLTWTTPNTGGSAITSYDIQQASGTTNLGLTTFPTIQRRGYGLRDSGSLRKDLGI